MLKLPTQDQLVIDIEEKIAYVSIHPGICYCITGLTPRVLNYALWRRWNTLKTLLDFADERPGYWVMRIPALPKFDPWHHFLAEWTHDESPKCVDLDSEAPF